MFKELEAVVFSAKSIIIDSMVLYYLVYIFDTLTMYLVPPDKK